jgi:hypothetical protein
MKQHRIIGLDRTLNCEMLAVTLVDALVFPVRNTSFLQPGERRPK